MQIWNIIIYIVNYEELKDILCKKLNFITKKQNYFLQTKTCNQIVL